MDKVTKVSISGISFTLEDNAYSILKEYLNRLNSHYSNYPNGQEIVEGIEERIAELLVDAGGKSRVVSLPMIQKVLDTVGKPEEIYEDSETRQSHTSADGPRKRLYRNPNDKVIAGVCGGFGAYFHKDPLWFRIGFVLLTAIPAFTNHGWWNPFTFIMIYFILCICIPKAVTTAQKCAMRGESLSYDEIERNAASRREEHNESALGNLLRIFCKGVLAFIVAFIGFILLIVGFAAIITVIAVTFGISVAGAVIPEAVISAVGMAIGISPFTSILTKVLLGLVILLPIIAIIYGGVKLIFKVKTPRWRPGLIMLLIWCLSVTGLIAIGAKTSSNFLNQSSWEKSEVIVPASDTIYVQFSGEDNFTDKKIIARGDREEYSFIYIDTDTKDSALIAIYPSIELNRSSDSEECSVEVSSTLFDNAMSYEERKEKEKLNFFSFRNDTLTVNPICFGQDSPITEMGREMTITVPENVKVIIPKPIYHQFENEFEHFDTKYFEQKTLRKIEKNMIRWNGSFNFNDWFGDDEQ